MRKSRFEEGRSRWECVERVRPLLLTYLRRGNTLKHSCRVAGISTRTFYNWMDRARHDKAAPDALVDLYYAYEEARAEGMRCVLDDLEKDVEILKVTEDDIVTETRSDPSSMARWRLELLDKGFQPMEERSPAPLMSSMEGE